MPPAPSGDDLGQKINAAIVTGGDDMTQRDKKGGGYGRGRKRTFDRI